MRMKSKFHRPFPSLPFCTSLTHCTSTSFEIPIGIKESVSILRHRSNTKHVDQRIDTVSRSSGLFWFISCYDDDQIKQVRLHLKHTLINNETKGTSV
ncbi:hypothetical protein L208DRAFT_593773 [Tricholoma matsutake]|nr:hypothetical protein L208DRAFT_593773 [Tricholoma matsutake 945]